MENVLIVGAGPVGLTMAADLARYGVAVRVVEKASAATDKSKALVLWSRSLELLDRMGVSPSLVAAGMKIPRVRITSGKEEIAAVDVTGVETPHPYALMLPQSETERLLQEHLDSIGIAVERSVELLSFVASESGVSSVLRHADGRVETFESGWLVGCDGAHSTVRHQLGSEFVGYTMPTNWMIADVHLAGLANTDEVLIAWHSAGLLALFPITPNRYRVIADIGDGAAPSAPTMEEVQKILDERGPGGVLASDPVWLTSFTINERMVEEYRAGRVFLMGDAAHIHSPAGGRGMNTGMQDACNLAWKLAMVCRGSAAEEPLLGSYSPERSVVAKAVLEGAGTATQVALLHGEIKQSLRNHLASFLLGFAPVEKKVAAVLTELSVAYPDSPLNGEGKAVGGGPKAGERAPIAKGEAPVGAGNAPRFALFADEKGSAAVLAEFSEVLEPEVRKPFEKGGVWLVRPDGYVGLATTDWHWDDVAKYLRRIVAGGAVRG